ncbi:MAG: class I SAM-dependent methyltransferase [Verrucomicrobia bacterium]|jgi:SAM-dependent methyltransferase|nr:class I SAM-dependent methyltransferase [Verrucomicrobiota bacterium]
MSTSLRDSLALPEKQNVNDLDDPDTTLLHATILKKKVFLQRLYTEYYQSFRAALDAPEDAVIVELGSGGGFIKDVMPNAITSDILPIPGLDQRFDAAAMPFEPCSIDLICMINTLHHIPDVTAMLKECTRCLKPGGRVVMVEPANTPFSRLIYQNLHHEPFDPHSDWSVPEGGPLSSSNQALPWIVFKRDRERFETTFPELELESMRLHTPLRYMLSGGFTARQMLPGWMYPAAYFLDEVLLRPFHGIVALSMTVTLQRVARP